MEEYGDNNTRVKLEAVTMFDNNSYKKLRTIIIDHAVKLGTSEHPSISLELDRDVLLVRVRTTSKTRTLIWRLLGKDDDNDKQDTDRSCVSNEAELRSITSSTSTRDRPPRPSRQRRPRSSRINDAEAELQGLIDSLSDSASSTTMTMRTRYRTRESS